MNFFNLTVIAKTGLQLGLFAIISSSTLVFAQTSANPTVPSPIITHPVDPIHPQPPHPIPPAVENAVCKSVCMGSSVSRVWLAKHDNAGSTQACGSINAARPDLVIPCGTYTCENSTGLCKMTCQSTADCARGNSCVYSECVANVPVSYSCSSDLLTLVGTDGKSYDCSPFLCQGSQCLKTCVTSGDCVPGTVCDVGGTNLCVRPH